VINCVQQHGIQALLAPATEQATKIIKKVTHKKSYLSNATNI